MILCRPIFHSFQIWNLNVSFVQPTWLQNISIPKIVGKHVSNIVSDFIELHIFFEYYPTYLVHKRENWKIVSTRKCVHPQIAVHCTVLFTIYFRMNTKQSITCFNLLHLINVFKISDIQYSFCLSMFFNGVKKTVENVREMHFIPIFDFRRKYKVLNHPKHPNVILAKQKCFHFVFVSKMKFSLKPESYMGYKLRIHSLV